MGRGPGPRGREAAGARWGWGSNLRGAEGELGLQGVPGAESALPLLHLDCCHVGAEPLDLSCLGSGALCRPRGAAPDGCMSYLLSFRALLQHPTGPGLGDVGCPGSAPPWLALRLQASFAPARCGVAGRTPPPPGRLASPASRGLWGPQRRGQAAKGASTSLEWGVLSAESVRELAVRQPRVRPKLPLLKILQAAGAQGEMFTVKEVMHYLGQYIMVKQLYDQQEQHMVYCDGDLLGELLGRQSFSVKDPSKVQRKVLVPEKKLKRVIFPHCLPQSINAEILEEDIGTAIVSDTTDDLWFLNESVSEQLGVGIKVEAADTEQASEEVGKVSDKKMIEVGKNDDLEDSKSLSDDTDIEVTSEDEWQCTECKKFNSPSKRYCFRCWALRKDWYSDCSKLTHSLSTSDITAVPEKKENEGIDVPDCRRTVSAPVVRPKDVSVKEGNSKLFNLCNSVEFLDLVHSSESQETISSMGEQSDNLSEQRTDVENMEDCQNILKPCSLCEKRP
ncbi:Protein Mdm4 [Sciurus carolinensis]|uniref:Protein Mdm4 n=1 Tax=Sciurus carolinensis TaxID=30640 RepID=A0AA41MZ48_SCICA|nr:Protein Mdm4 [Sciurus carolinensis]